MTQLFDLNARIQQLTWSLIFYEKYSTSLSAIVLVVLTTANFGWFNNFCRYYTRSQAGKSSGYRPTLKPLLLGVVPIHGWKYTITRMNCFRYLKLMSPLNAAICTTTYLERQKCYGPGKKILFKKQLFDLEVKGQGPAKVITVRDTPSYGHAPTYQISLTYLERQKCYGPDKKILFKKQLFDFEIKGQGPTKVITVCDTPPYGHAPTYQMNTI